MAKPIVNKTGQVDQVAQYVVASTRIPYALIRDELEVNGSDYLAELADIVKYYKIYKTGAEFTTEGSLGDYVPSQIKMRECAQLINKEARFLFAESPDIIVEPKGDKGVISDDAKKSIAVLQELVNAVLSANMFDKFLLQSAKDCFVGKRVGISLTFNEATGITVSFFDAFSFIYETDPGNTSIVTKFVSFTIMRHSSRLAQKRIFKKKYQMVEGILWMEEIVYDGRGVEIEVVTEFQPTKMTIMPATVIFNDGLLGEDDGESEITQLMESESTYSKLANADIDAERKGMNSIKYTIDMDPSCTSNLKTSPGAFWDMHSDQNMDNPKPEVGSLDAKLDYSAPLDMTLNRIKNSMYEQLDIPNINLETMSGIITSGKGLKAIYWPLSVRCKEKMKTWGPQLSYIIDAIITGALVYPATAQRYVNEPITPAAHIVTVVRNSPIDEDENEEKTADLAEVNSQTMSKKSFMKKWRELTDNEADEELKQIAAERELLEDSATGMMI